MNPARSTSHATAATADVAAPAGQPLVAREGRDTGSRDLRAVRLRRAAPPLVIVLFVVAVLHRFVLQGLALYWGDLYLYFYPLEEYVRSALRDGRVPLWNPYVLCGQPLVGNPQSWVFYPTTALLPFVPTWLYFTLNTALHLALAGWGTYLFLRRLCSDRMGATLGAIAYSGSGFVVARLQFPTMTMAAAWLPWLLILVDRHIERPRVYYSALLAAVVALELLAGHAQLAYLALACAVLYALARLWQIRRHRARALRALGGMAAALSVGLLAASIAVLPALQLFALSTRERLPWMQANRFVLLPEQLIGYVLPYFYGQPARRDYWGEGNFWEPCVYIGIVPLVLAIYAAVRAARRPAARFFAVAAFVALWLALGRFGGLYWIAFHVVPGLASFHDPARFAFLATFGFAALSAVGMRALRDRGLSGGVRAAVVALAALDLAAFGSAVNPAVQPSALAYRPSALSDVPRDGDGRVFTVYREQVWKRLITYADYGPASARYVRDVADTLTPNVGMGLGVEEAAGYEPVPVKAVTDLGALVQTAVDRQSPQLPRLLSLFDAKVLLMPGATRYRHPALEQLAVRHGGASILRVRRAVASPGAPGAPAAAPVARLDAGLGRAWLVRHTERIDGDRRSLSAVGAPEFDPAALAVVSGSAGLSDSADLGGPAADEAPGRVRLLHASAGHLDLAVDAGTAPGFVVVSSAWYPGWICSVDAHRAAIERADHAFMGVVVPPGRHTLELRYEPFVVRAGLYLTLCAALLIAAGLAFGAAFGVSRRPMAAHAAARRATSSAGGLGASPVARGPKPVRSTSAK